MSYYVQPQLVPIPVGTPVYGAPIEHRGSPESYAPGIGGIIIPPTSEYPVSYPAGPPPLQQPYPEPYLPVGSSFPAPGYGYTDTPREGGHNRLRKPRHHRHHDHHRYDDDQPPRSYSDSYSGPHDFNQDHSDTYDQVFHSDPEDDPKYGHSGSQGSSYPYGSSPSYSSSSYSYGASPSHSSYSSPPSQYGYGPNDELVQLAMEALRRTLSRFMDQKYLSGEDNGLVQVAEYALRYGLEAVLNHTLGDGEEHKTTGRIARRGVEDGHDQVAEDALRRGFNSYSYRYGSERGTSSGDADSEAIVR
ncbi:hypothetical protein Moror_4693 [Moniliophthora roreri MCA 2997]|uniref:Uncharacterized protein n=1 Tax=Moniliophthora roreri (strain MCA 2997) TaxID=1381753 RepID=V2XIG4_MONRO|nr:hypothetical protein Moror_4693 [Moniliophthora roreri MCA 2997]